MFVQRYYLDCLSHASYMVADEQAKVAAVIDPQRDIEIYIQDAAEHGFEIRYVLLTHFHADFVAGHIELRDRVGAEIVLAPRAAAEFAHIKLGDGQSIQIGNVRLEGLETPGHTPEGLTILAYDKNVDDSNPYAAFTGDTLFIGDVGRPDLLASIGVTANELASMLYDSVHQKLLNLPDQTLVYPAHGAGSLCGKSLSSEVVSTIGEQRKYNYALQPMSREAFMKLVEADQPDAPGYFVHDAIMNRKERESLDQTMAGTMKPLDLQAVLDLQAQGAQVVDTRDAQEFAGAHLKGSINVGIDGKYATWAGTVLKKDAPIVIIADDERVTESIVRLGRIGFDHVAGYLDGGLEQLKQRADLLETVQRVTAPAVGEIVPTPTVIDVRAEKEWAAGHLKDSINIPLNHLEERIFEVPKEGPVVVHCQGGYRSSIAVSILQRHGRRNLLDLVGGYKAWAQSGLPVVEPEGSIAGACTGGACSG